MVIYIPLFPQPLVDYKRTKDKIKIICAKHGIFIQSLNNHLKNGCNKCAIEQKKLKLNEFIKIANKIHDNKYDYSLVKYINAHHKISIICPKHGIFNQTPNSHVAHHNGCPTCSESKGEKKIRIFLKNRNIIYTQEKKFKNCKNINSLIFDFYLPKFNCCIEFDGPQHFKPIDFLGGEKYLNYIQNNDKIKNEFCKKNEIKLLRIRYDENIEEKLTLFIT